MSSDDSSIPTDDVSRVQEPAAAAAPSEPNYSKLTNIAITSEVVALNVMVSFLNLAQKRGSFNLEESAKIWECIRVFIPPSAVAAAANAPSSTA
jgi:hypothetical protein